MEIFEHNGEQYLDVGDPAIVFHMGKPPEGKELLGLVLQRMATTLGSSLVTYHLPSQDDEEWVSGCIQQATFFARDLDKAKTLYKAISRDETVKRSAIAIELAIDRWCHAELAAESLRLRDSPAEVIVKGIAEAIDGVAELAKVPFQTLGATLIAESSETAEDDGDQNGAQTPHAIRSDEPTEADLIVGREILKGMATKNPSVRAFGDACRAKGMRGSNAKFGKMLKRMPPEK